MACGPQSLGSNAIDDPGAGSCAWLALRCGCQEDTVRARDDRGMSAHIATAVVGLIIIGAVLGHSYAGSQQGSRPAGVGARAPAHSAAAMLGVTGPYARSTRRSQERTNETEHTADVPMSPRRGGHPG